MKRIQQLQIAIKYILVLANVFLIDKSTLAEAMVLEMKK